MNESPSIDLALPWKLGRTQDYHVMLLDSKDRYCCSIQIHQTPRHMGFYDEPRRRACAKLILDAVNEYVSLLAEKERQAERDAGEDL